MAAVSGLAMEKCSFDARVFAHNQERVLSGEAAPLFFAEVYELLRGEGWASEQHFTANGTLIDARAG